MLRFLKRHRSPVIVAALVIYPFASYLTRGHRGRSRHMLDNAVLGVALPLERLLTMTFGAAASAVSGYATLWRANERNLRLAAENAELRAEVNSQKELAAENERLKRDLAYAAPAGEHKLIARVIGVGPSASFLSVRIDRGRKDGVVPGLSVVTPDGVVGRVSGTTGGFADVALLTDKTTKMGVVVQRTRLRATASGTGEPKALSLENVLRTEETIADGDTLITSGTDGIFPKGLVVGSVDGLTRPGLGMFLKAIVVPAVELNRLEEVIVLLPQEPR